jgi:hypothetical protein
MVADIARVTYDRTRQYRFPIYQQGRVTLEADNNEATTLASEALRLETVDIIGPTGAVEDGYEVGPGKGPDGVTIHAGTFYLGGWRLELDKAIDISPHPAADKDGISKGNFAVALLLTEQSVCAVEDQALREVALGGPDTAARMRLMQKFLRIPVKGDTCAEAKATVLGLLENEGIKHLDHTLQLISAATLKVAFVQGPPSTDPCTPAAAGGYLGADNQMVRVTVTEFSGNGGKLLWGWNDASLLYRATPSSLTLTLANAPVDQEHAPQLNQMVEILRTELVLGDGNYLAEKQGHVTSVAQAYSFDSSQLTLADLPLDYQKSTNPLFVRLWQSSVPFTVNTPTQLDNVSGITITISMPSTVTLPPAAGTIVARPFWHFAVRPLASTNIFPQRYLENAQPPDGPRQWITDLAVIEALGGEQEPKLLADCRVPFLPLTKQHDCSCCSLVLDPEKNWLSTLNQAIASTTITTLNVCFMPGTFNVTTKITVSGKTVRMTGAGFGSKIVGAGLEAVLEFDNCSAVDLSDLYVEAGITGYSKTTNTVNLQGAVTIRSCSEVDIERVWLVCADGDLRAASCLAIYNPLPPAATFTATTAVPSYNARILNSQFQVGHFQVGILIVNADRAQIEGNLVVNPLASRNINMTNLASHLQVAYRLRKQLIQAMTLINTAPPATKKARAKVRKRQAAAAAAKAAAGKTVKKAAAAAKTQPAAAGTEVVKSEVIQPAAAEINLGAIGRAHIKATFGTFHLQFISSATLTSAWTDALRASGLSQTSTMGAIHKAVKSIATAVVLKPATVSAAFRNWLAAALPQLYSTSSQGIVVGGNLANDVRILNNTVDGTAQGIHVGLSDIKHLGKHSGHLSATRVQIRGNTVNLRITPEVNGDRHGIYLGCVTSAVISDNHLQLSRVPSSAAQTIDAIKVAGVFGPLLLIERNCMLGFSTGLYTDPDETSLPKGSLWMAAENASDVTNQIAAMFTVANNVS